MAYAEQDRVYIREFVGYGAIFLQAKGLAPCRVTGR
jgi:hypothetical protein